MRLSRQAHVGSDYREAGLLARCLSRASGGGQLRARLHLQQLVVLCEVAFSADPLAQELI